MTRAARRRADGAASTVSVTLTAPVEGVRTDRESRTARPIVVRAAAMFAGSQKGNAARARRRATPIMSYVGPNGAGKTLIAVRDCLPSLDEGRLVYSTVPLLDAATGVPHESYRPFTGWPQLMEAEHADFLADEISGIAASRDHNNLHSDVINRLHQLRKADLTFRWTAPAWRRADLALREVTWAVTECRGYLPDRAAVKDGDVLWAPRRLFRAQTYDMREFDEWSAGKRERVRSDVREWFVGEGSREFRSYDTLAAVDRLEGYDPKACLQCGKPRRTDYCRGH